jgi:hypothetical protein
MLALAACADDFEKQSHISKLRVLAVQAEPAEIIVDMAAQLPSVTLKLRALAVDPRGAPIEVRWALCTVQDSVPSPSLDCPGSQGFDLPAESSVGALDLSSATVRPLYAALLSGQAPDQVQKKLTKGMPVILGFEATSGDEVLPGLTAITLRNPVTGPVNQNPALGSLLASGVELRDDGTSELAAGSTVRLDPIPAAGAHEITEDGTPEKLNYSFFATDGEVKSLRSTDTTASGEAADPSVDWIAPKMPGVVQLWVVVRDGRGGVGWITRTVLVR